MKIATAIFVPVISALIIARMTIPVEEPEEAIDPTEFSYTMPWSYGSLDEAVWLAVDDLATIKKYMPSKVDHFSVVIPPYGSNTNTFHLSFARADLELLAAGELTTEIFIREYVQFE